MQHEIIDTTAATTAAPRLTIARADLFPALDLMAKRLVERRNTIPILSNVIIEAAANGDLRLIATDLDMQMSATLPAQWEMPGCFTVNVQTLRDIVSKVDKAAIISMHALDGYVTVTSGRIKQRLPVLPVDDFPTREFKIDFTFEAPQTLIADLAMVAPFAESSGKNSRYYLQGVAMDVAGGELNFVATDGHIMSRVLYPAPDALELSEAAIIPSKTITILRAIGKMMGGTTPLVGISDKAIEFDFGAIVVTSKLIDGTYTNWRRLNPIGEMSGLMLPELDARFPSGLVNAFGKAVAGDLQWETGAVDDLVIAYVHCPTVPHWTGIIAGTKEPVYPQGYFADGECTVEADGVIYPVAVKSGRIHLSAETVAALCGPVDPSTHVYIPTHTYWRGKCVAIDGVPTADMPAGYKVNPIAPKGKQRYDVLVKMLDGETAPIDAPISGPETVDPIDDEGDGQDRESYTDDQDRDGYTNDDCNDCFTPSETPQDIMPATTLAGTSEIAPHDAEIALADNIEAQPDHVSELLARMDALESRLESVASAPEPHPFVGIMTDTPISGKPKRTAAHIRAIMAYLAMRRVRDLDKRALVAVNGNYRAVEAERDAARDKLMGTLVDRDDWKKIAEQNAARVDELERTIINLDKRICDDRDQMTIMKAKRGRAVLKARDMQNRLCAEHKLVDRHADKRSEAEKQLSVLKAKLADPANPARESDMLLLRGNAEAWQAKANAAIAEGERLKRVVLQNADHIETLASRIARAERMLREQDALPSLKVVAG